MKKSFFFGFLLGICTLIFIAAGKNEIIPIPQAAINTIASAINNKENTVDWNTNQFTVAGAIKSGAIITNVVSPGSSSTTPAFALGAGIGIYDYATDCIGFASQNSCVAVISPAGVGSSRFWGLPAGTASEPTFYTDPGTGIFKSATNAIGFATSGTEQWMINASGSLVPVGTNDIGNGSANPRYVFAGTDFAVGTQHGISTTIDVIVSGNTTNRLVFVGGILVTNLTGI